MAGLERFIGLPSQILEYTQLGEGIGKFKNLPITGQEIQAEYRTESVKHPRFTQILKLTAQGYSYVDIARILDISPLTVKNLRDTQYYRYEATSVSHIVALGYQNG